MKKARRKLRLNRETLCHLEQQGLKNVHGGTDTSDACFFASHCGCATGQDCPNTWMAGTCPPR
jgi:hypothetical protein